MSKSRFECRHVILKNWAQMTPGSETLTYVILENTINCVVKNIIKFVRLSNSIGTM